MTLPWFMSSKDSYALRFERRQKGRDLSPPMTVEHLAQFVDFDQLLSPGKVSGCNPGDYNVQVHTQMTIMCRSC